MAPKKKDKDVEVLKQPKIDHLQTDHELFMQAFEKPTQIYRYLRTRNMISPIFLNRNLSYMRHRMSRSHKTRNIFKIDTMLAQKMNKMRNDKASGISLTGEYLTLLFLGFFDKTQDDDAIDVSKNKVEITEIGAKTVQVETVLLKISHNKRKDISSALMQVAIGKSDVTVNPTEMPPDGKVPTISIATESFSSVGVNQVTGPQLSFLLLFRVHMHTSGGNGYCSISNGVDVYENCGSDEEPAAKRQKISGTTRLYGTELIIFDKYGRCLLKEGDYELTVQEILPHQQQLQKYNSPKKNSTWETIQPINGDRINVDILDIYKQHNGMDDQNPVLVFSKSPSLKFRLQWTKEALPGLVDRPKPIMINLNNNEGNDKENHKPEKQPSYRKNLNININNNSILTPAAVNGHANSGCLMDANTTALVAIGALSTTANSCVPSNELKRYTDEPKIDHIIYQFVYNNNSRQQTETKLDFHCPWCSLNCSSLYPLLKHLKLCHARFIFTYIPIPNGARIDVSINELYDGSYNGSPHDLLDTVSAFSRRGPVRRTVVTNLLVCRPRRQKHSLVEFIECDENEFDSQRPFITGHNRMYHHTMTCLPVHPKELDIDSEGESDPLWLQYKTMQMIDEFTDVNEGEKELMKMWNLHVMKYGYVGDCQIPIALEMFIECRGRELLNKNLYRNFILHMSSMFDFGLVSPEAMQKTIRKLQKLLFESPDLQREVTITRKEQMEYWTTVTVHKQVQPKTEKTADKASAGASGTPSTPLHKSSASGSGTEKKVKPTITPAKNTGSQTNTASSMADKTEDHPLPIAWRLPSETTVEHRLLPPEGNHFPLVHTSSVKGPSTDSPFADGDVHGISDINYLYCRR
ncbi:polycomb protein suz12-B isoform X2 [Topomyia yanbarensis]|uniref:polycomb protein suz12-B isoform X2 n=1 Tax=Topomyia yanbarensis TaxID=2498891 RepID=UPI00273A8F39|nr:polycomb protein suz12-B isoform X2 [Topomyia yanbarensis]